MRFIVDAQQRLYETGKERAATSPVLSRRDVSAIQEQVNNAFRDAVAGKEDTGLKLAFSLGYLDGLIARERQRTGNSEAVIEAIIEQRKLIRNECISTLGLLLERQKKESSPSTKEDTPLIIPIRFKDATTPKIRALYAGRLGSRKTLSGKLFHWLGRRVFGKTYEEEVMPVPQASEPKKDESEKAKESEKATQKEEKEKEETENTDSEAEAQEAKKAA